ncbi:MAG TPA: hypothetical protein VF818_09955 [Ktedonobacterales bacterium]
MQLVTKIATLVIGVIGALDALIINILFSLFHEVGRIAGASWGQSHGFIGAGIVVLALVGAGLALWNRYVGAVLLLIAGVAFFFVVSWWALLASPQLIIAGALPFLDEIDAGRSVERSHGGPLATNV